MRILAILLSALTAAAAAAARGSRALAEHERVAVPRAWTRAGDAAPSDTLRLHIALRHEYALSDDDIRARSNPASALHGRFLSAADLRAARNHAASTRSLQRVEQWLADHHVAVAARAAHGFDLTIETPVRLANALLRADFGYYRARDDGARLLRTAAYSLPAHLQQHIAFVYPTVHFFSPASAPRLEKRQHGIPTGPVNCTGNTCPLDLATRYHVDYYPPNAKSCASLGIAGFLEQYPDQHDFGVFQANYSLHRTPPVAPYRVVSINGGKDPNSVADATTEAMLDLEYATALTGPLAVSYFSTGGRPPTLEQPGNKTVDPKDSQQEPFLELFDALLAMDSPPQVLSISYSDDEMNVPQRYAEYVCTQLSHLAARGVSVVGSSGDGGTQGTLFSDCINPAGNFTFIPTFPSSCPWMTSVGALAFYGGPSSYSSGGFSNYFPRPAYQDKAVSSYLTYLNNSHDGFFNPAGRAYPDVSLLGDGYVLVVGNVSAIAKGSSASTPVFAAMVALLNDLRLRAGKPVLGFLNERIYGGEWARVWKDVTDGNINGCANAKIQEAGFEAGPGWDAASGWGAVDWGVWRGLQ